jgi:hypothetical protein
MPSGVTFSHSDAGNDGLNACPTGGDSADNVRMEKERLENMGTLGQ